MIDSTPLLTPANGQLQADPTDLVNRAVQINRKIAVVGQALANSVRFAIEAGQLLIEARKSCPHGKWLPWLETNVECSRATAYTFMRLAENRCHIESVIDSDGLTLTKALQLIDDVRPRTKDARLPAVQIATPAQNANFQDVGNLNQAAPSAPLQIETTQAEPDAQPDPKPVERQPKASVKGEQILERRVHRLKNGREIHKPSDRQEAEVSLRRLTQAIERLGLFKDLESHLDALAEALRW